MSAAFYGLWLHRRLPRHATRVECARWLHDTCARGLRTIHVQLAVEGQPPASGLIVSNHLSYLDILSCSAAIPCVFVSKAEVEQWPIFGRYARWAGSVFVQRQARGDAARANLNVKESLKDGVPVVLFPEGTTSDGQRVARFHSTMLQPAIDAGSTVTPCAIRYEVSEGDVGSEVSWWGEMPLLPHVLNLMSKPTIRARILFGQPIAAVGDRKPLGVVLHEEVIRLHQKLMADCEPDTADRPTIASRSI
jgi:lyso-ornithine lipid O-acyltransferase